MTLHVNHRDSDEIHRLRAEVARLREMMGALKPVIEKIHALGCALHNDGFVAANDCWRMEDALRSLIEGGENGGE